jgi:hypothetical protein
MQNRTQAPRQDIRSHPEVSCVGSTGEQQRVWPSGGRRCGLPRRGGTTVLLCLLVLSPCRCRRSRAAPFFSWKYGGGVRLRGGRWIKAECVEYKEQSKRIFEMRSRSRRGQEPRWGRRRGSQRRRRGRFEVHGGGSAEDEGASGWFRPRPTSGWSTHTAAGRGLRAPASACVAAGRCPVAVSLLGLGGTSEEAGGGSGGEEKATK